MLTFLTFLEEAPPSQGLGDFLFPVAAILAIFWFVLILPERKKQKERQALLDGVKKGDQVMTTSGIFGRVAALHDETMVLEVADGVRLKFSRAALQTVEGADKGAKGEKGKGKGKADSEGVGSSDTATASAGS